MKCPYCGRENSDRADFCHNCGLLFDDSGEQDFFAPVQEKKAGAGKKKGLFAIICVLVCLFIIASASLVLLDKTGHINVGNFSSFGEKSDDASVTVGTGGSQGTYYAFSSSLFAAISDHGIDFCVISSGGSLQNINEINEGSYDMAICQGDIMNYAYEGINTFSSPIKNFYAVAGAYTEICQLVVSERSGIYTFEDLKGKTVALGERGSGVYYNAKHILEVAGIDIENDITPVFSSFADSAMQLKDETVDAAFITASLPTLAISDIGATVPVRIFDIPDDIIDDIVSKYPFYIKTELDGSDYSFISQPVSTVALKTVYIASAKMSEEDVYTITKAIWEDPDVASCHAKSQELDINTTLIGMGSVPLHPGAERYYRERGIF